MCDTNEEENETKNIGEEKSDYEEYCKIYDMTGLDEARR